MLDGELTIKGDNVFDLFLGTGQVQDVAPDGAFTVDFGGRVMRYSAGGVVSGVKRLYWRNPIMVVPRKTDADAWELYARLIAAVKG